MPHTFPQQFKDLMDRYAVTQQQLGSWLHSSASSINRRIHGKYKFPEHELKRVCKEFFKLTEERTEEVVELYKEFWAEKHPEDHLVVQSEVFGQAQLENRVHLPTVPLDHQKRVPYFTLRLADESENEIQKIVNDLHPEKIVTLYGPPGIGKTTLAIEVIWTLSPDRKPPHRFPDGIIFHSFYKQPSVNAALEQIARKLGEGEYATKPTPRDAAQRAMSKKQALIILDGVEEADDLDKALDVGGLCGFLLTTWHRGDIRGKEHTVGIMPPDKARTILEDWSQGQITQQETADQICELVGYLPLALRIAGSYMFRRALSALEYLELLKKTPLKALILTQRQRECIPLLMETSLKELSEPAREAFAVVGVLAFAPFDREVISTALDLPKIDIFERLGELVDYSFLERTDTNLEHQVVHRLIHTYAEKLDAPDEAITRLAEYYTTRAEELRKHNSSTTLLHTEQAHMITVLDNCVERKLWKQTLNLAEALTRYWNIQGYDEKIVATAGLEASHALEKTEVKEDWILKLATAYINLGQLEIATNYLKQELDTAYEPRARSMEVKILNSIGTIYMLQGKYSQAIQNLQQSMDLLCDVERDYDSNILAVEDKKVNGKLYNNDVKSLCSLTHGLGLVYADLHQFRRAISFFETSLEISRKLDDQDSEASCLSGLGVCYYRMGETEKAIAYLDQALTIARQIRDTYSEGCYMGQLGEAYCVLGQTEVAISYLKEALGICHQLENRRHEQATLGAFGMVHQTLGQTRQAITYYEQALTIARDMGDTYHEGVWLSHLGSVYVTTDQWQPARDCYSKTISLIHDTINQNVVQEADIYKLIIVIEVNETYLKHHTRAGQIFFQDLLGELFSITYPPSYPTDPAKKIHDIIQVYKSSLDKNELPKIESYDYHPNNAPIFDYYGDMNLSYGEIDVAKSLYQARIDLLSKNALNAYVGLGVIALHQGNEVNAQEEFEKSLNTYKEALKSDFETPARLLNNVAVALLGLGRQEEAIDTLKKALARCEPNEQLNPIRYELLTKASNPPSGLDSIRYLLKEKERT